MYPNNLEYVNQILEICVRMCQLQPTKSINESCLKSIVALLIIPLESLSMEVLTMPNYTTMAEYLTPSMLKVLARKIIISIVNSRRLVQNMELVQRIVNFLKNLCDADTVEEDLKNDAYEFDETLTYAAKLVHLINCEDPTVNFQAITLLKETFDKGGLKVLRYSTPAIVNEVYCLIGKVAKSTTEETPGSSKLPILKVYQFVYQAIDAIGQSYPDSAIRLFLQGVLSMNQVVTAGTDIEELGYQFASQALVLYQDELTDADSKLRAISLVISTLERTVFFSADNFDTLVINLVQYCAKLIRQEDQSQALLMCSHLFCCSLLNDPERFEKCLKKALSSCKSCKSLNSYTRVLNKYIWYYNSLGTVKAEQVKEVMEMIRKRIEDSGMKNTFFAATVAAIRFKSVKNENYKALL